MSDYGFGGMGATLAARMSLLPWRTILNTGVGPGPTVESWELFLDTELPAVMVLVVPPDPLANFPYGLLVEDDGPV